MERSLADVTHVRNRFNSRYHSVIYHARFLGRAADSFDNGQQQRLQKTSTKRCNDLAESEETAALFEKPESRLSSAELNRKVRDLVVLARHVE
jgi:hypothetical protein